MTEAALAAMHSLITCSTAGWYPTGSISLGTAVLNGRNRVAFPAAVTTAVQSGGLTGLWSFPGPFFHARHSARRPGSQAGGIEQFPWRAVPQRMYLGPTSR